MGTRITDLPAATSVNPADVVPIVQDGTTKKAATSLIKTTNASELSSGTVASARLPLGSTSAVGAVQLGSTAGTACEGNDARLSNSRTPTGAAGGDLSGTYPNPTIAPLSPSPAGVFGSATAIPQITVNAKGQVTSVSGVAPQATVSSVNVSGGATGLTFSGGPVINSGTITMSGTLGIGAGGTGATTAAGVRTNLGLATSATVDTTNAANITSGTLAAARMPGLSGDVSAPVNSTTTTLANTGVTAGTYGSSSVVPVLTVDAKGRVTDASTVTPVISANNITSGTLNPARLDNSGVAQGTYGSSVTIPQLTVDSKGRVTNVGDIPISGSAGGTVVSVGVQSGTLVVANSPVTYAGDIAVNLATTGVSAMTVGSSSAIPVLGVDQYGRVTSLTTAAISSLSTQQLSGYVTTQQIQSYATTAQISGLTNSAQVQALTTAQLNAITFSAGTGLSGGGTLAANRTFALATTGVSAGTFGSTAQIPVLTVNAQGQITSASSVSFSAGGVPTAIGYLRETVTTSATAATGTINIDALTQPTLFYTLNATNNFTLNVRGDGTTTIDSLLTSAQSLTVTFLNTNGATPYGVSALNIDGSARTVKWLAGTGAIPNPNANSIDAWTFTIIKTASNTFTVLGSLSKFF